MVHVFEDKDEDSERGGAVGNESPTVDMERTPWKIKAKEITAIGLALFGPVQPVDSTTISTKPETCTAIRSDDSIEPELRCHIPLNALCVMKQKVQNTLVNSMQKLIKADTGEYIYEMDPDSYYNQQSNCTRHGGHLMTIEETKTMMPELEKEKYHRKELTWLGSAETNITNAVNDTITKINPVNIVNSTSPPESVVEQGYDIVAIVVPIVVGLLVLVGLVALIVFCVKSEKAARLRSTCLSRICGKKKNRKKCFNGTVQNGDVALDLLG